jgi:hypothetical protein
MRMETCNCYQSAHSFSPALWCSECFAAVQGTSVQHSDVELVGPISHIEYTHFYY